MNTNTTRFLSVDSWLLAPDTPLPPEDNGLGWPPGEARLWWAVVRQSAKDVLTLPESEALDAAEYIRYSGCYLLDGLFAIPVEETNKELARLIKLSPSLRRVVNGLRYS